MANRSVCDSVLGVNSRLIGQPLASPFRRDCAFLIDLMILLLPSMVVTVAAAVLSLSLTDPSALNAIRTIWASSSLNQTVSNRVLGELAPLLVRMQAPGLPPDIVMAVEESNLHRAGELLSSYEIEFALIIFQDPPPLQPYYLRINVDRLIPKGFRAAALFGVAALYFTFFASRRRKSTPGKWLLRIQVLRLDGCPLTIWQSFERFGGYFASIGTLALDFSDFWLTKIAGLHTIGSRTQSLSCVKPGELAGISLRATHFCCHEQIVQMR